MDKMTAVRISGGNSAYGRVKSDFYPTPANVTQALIDFLKIRKGLTIWEPACGDGDMVKVIECNGYLCIGTDIKTGTDFLKADPVKCQWIITNPPFSQAEQFIKKCAGCGVPFALLLKSQYWHAHKRLALFRENKPGYILPLTWRPDFLFKTRGNGSPLMDVIWAVWREKSAESTIYFPLEKPKEAHDGN